MRFTGNKLFMNIFKCSRCRLEWWRSWTQLCRHQPSEQKSHPCCEFWYFFFRFVGHTSSFSLPWITDLIAVNDIGLSRIISLSPSLSYNHSSQNRQTSVNDKTSLRQSRISLDVTKSPFMIYLCDYHDYHLTMSPYITVTSRSHDSIIVITIWVFISYTEMIETFYLLLKIHFNKK